MSGESFNIEKKTIDLAPIVNKLLTKKNQININGSVNERDYAERSHLQLMIKKRRTTTSYKLPISWTSQRWTGMLNVADYELDRGIWDFYLYDNVNHTEYRVKTADEDVLEIAGENIYMLGEKPLRFNLYRTIKDSLSINIQTARISLKQLTAVVQQEKDTDSWDVDVEGMIEDPLLRGMLGNAQARLLIVQRITHDQFEYPVTICTEEEHLRLKCQVDYKKLINLEDVSKSEWDCHLLISEADQLPLRIHIHDDVDSPSLEHSSLFQFKDSHLFQIYFYETIKHNLSVKLHRVRIKRDIVNFKIEPDGLHLKGFAFVDVEDPHLDRAMKRYITVRKRESQDEFKVELPNIQGTESQPHQFATKIDWQEILDLEDVEKEIFDLALQIHYQGAVYERKLGFEEFTYIKDAVLDKTFLKNNDHYTRIYLTLTPWGNLKIETFYLTKAAYYYLKFGQKIDMKLNENKDIWLIGERANTAQDTGYHFFKYCREHYPERKIYYVINSHSKDIKHIESLGNVLYTGTLKHVRMASLASVFIGSHDLDNILPLKGLELASYVNGERVFLQHGVLGRKNVEYDKKYYDYPFHLFCVSSEPEKKLVENKMDYQPSEVKITGLSRFDELLRDREERQSILLMPTWREWLGNDDRFKDSIYYNRYKSLLTNEELHKLLQKHDMKLDFYPHYRMQPFIEEFKSFNSDRVNVIELGEKTVQQLLKENKLMITDYSSVSFDFNYMSKPIVFYHFDSKSFFRNGILRPMSKTFLGDICKQEDEVIESIRYYIEHGFKEREEIRNKKELVFSHIDTKNNKRIFKEISKIQE